MDRSNHQSGRGEAFIRVLVAVSGLRLAKPESDLDGIDFCLWSDQALRANAQGLEVSIVGVMTRTGHRTEFRPPVLLRAM